MGRWRIQGTFPRWSLEAITFTYSNNMEIGMQRFALLLMLLLAIPNVTYGSSVANVGNALCLGEYSSSLQDNASFICGGDLSLSNGSIASGEKIIISSAGSLFIDDLHITAPVIEISSLQRVTIGSSVYFYNDFPGSSLPPSITLIAGGSLTIGSGNAVELISGGDINLTLGSGDQALIGGQIVLIDGGNLSLTPVPVPTSIALMLSAMLLCLAFNAGRKKPLENAIA